MDSVPLPYRENAKSRAYARAYRRGLRFRHVYKHANGWAIKRLSATRPSKILPKQREAIKEALEIAKRNNVGVLVYNSKGELNRIIYPD